MQVVNAVQIYVLYVPAEGRSPHAEVKIGRTYTRDLYTGVLWDRLEDTVQFAKEMNINLSTNTGVTIYKHYKIKQIISEWNRKLLIGL